METLKEFTNSSTVKRIDYSEENKELIVEFITGKRYSYANVPISVWEMALQAESIGRFLSVSIKGIYSYKAL